MLAHIRGLFSSSYSEGMDPSVKRQCDEILSFRRDHNGRLPYRGKNSSVEEWRLDNMRNKLQIRCVRALSAKPSHRKLNTDEIAYFKWAVSREPPASPEGRPSSKQDHTHGVAPPMAGEKRERSPRPLLGLKIPVPMQMPKEFARLPAMWITILAELWPFREVSLHGLDLFSGSSARFMQEMEQAGLACACFDILIDPMMNVLTYIGLRILFKILLNLFPSTSIILAGSPCKNFVYLSGRWRFAEART